MRRTSAAAAVALALLLVLATSASAAPPTIGYTIDGIAGTNGWYRGSTHGNNVVLHWSVSMDATASNCLAAVTIPGPTTGTTVSCWAENGDGRTTVTRVVKIDADPPTNVAPAFARPPDFNGWYNHPVVVAWGGADSTSGIASCSSVSYDGPAEGNVTVGGSCTDNAGNTTSSSVGFDYDATPPTLHAVGERSTATADVLRWVSTSAADRVVVRRSARAGSVERVVYTGSASGFSDTTIRPGVEYLYTVQSFDQAGNASVVVSRAGLPKVLTLGKTPYVPRAAPNPILRWPRQHGARYYNVQLFRGSKRVLAAWPAAHQLGLPKSWRWDGRHRRLAPGRYRWYVWAGVGARSFARYRTIGSAEFIVPR